MAKKKSKTKKTTKKTTKKPVKKEPKTDSKADILKSILIICVGIIILIVASYFYINSLKNYTHQNVEFETVQEGKLTLYQTAITIMYEGKLTPYNFYLRTNPKELKDIKFDSSKFELMKNTVLGFEDSFDCDGDEIIAIANLAKIHEVMGINIVRDENATCDERYMYLNLKKGEETKIEVIEDNCYNVIVSDCEILKVTERIMLEMFVQYNSH